MTLTDSGIGPITARGNVDINAAIVAENVGLISASDGNFTIGAEGFLNLEGDLAGITASDDINIIVKAVDMASITAKGSVGDLTAGGDINIGTTLRQMALETSPQAKISS